MYQGFATLYDRLMADVPYDTWAAYIHDVLQGALPPGSTPLVLDMACGTGSITLRLAALGYDMIGLDQSPDMLCQAQAKEHEADLPRRVLWLAQDMRQLDLYGTIHAAVCTCDGLNYILEEDELRDIFARVRLFMQPGGVFIFDMNTAYKFEKVLGDHSFEETNGQAACVWDNHFDSASQLNEYHVTFYTPGRGDAFTELHYQRAYNPGDICNWLLAAGFSGVQMRDGYTHAPLHAGSTRVVFIVLG